MAVKKKALKKKSVVKKKMNSKKSKKKVLKTKSSPTRTVSALKVSAKTKTYLEVRLSSLVVRENGKDSALPSSGTILVNWLYPRPGKQRVTAIIPFTNLADSQTGTEAKLDFANAKMYGNGFLFKEDIEGSSVITAEIAITKNPGLISKIIESVAKIGIKNLASPYVGSALGVVLDNAGLTKESARVIGRTSFELSANPVRGLHEGELFVPESFNVFKSNRIDFRAEDIDNFDEDEFEVGSFNGVLTLDIR